MNIKMHKLDIWLWNMLCFAKSLSWLKLEIISSFIHHLGPSHCQRKYNDQSNGQCCNHQESNFSILINSYKTLCSCINFKNSWLLFCTKIATVSVQTKEIFFIETWFRIINFVLQRALHLAHQLQNAKICGKFNFLFSMLEVCRILPGVNSNLPCWDLGARDSDGRLLF